MLIVGVVGGGFAISCILSGPIQSALAGCGFILSFGLLWLVVVGGSLGGPLGHFSRGFFGGISVDNGRRSVELRSDRLTAISSPTIAGLL